MYSILKGTIPLSMAHITNQIVFVCAFSNFQPALVPLPKEPEDSDVETYFEQLSDCDSDKSEHSDLDSDVDSDDADT